MGLLLKLILLPLWLPFKLVWELIEHSGRRGRRYSRQRSVRVSTLGWLVGILFLGSCFLVALIGIGAYAPWLLIAAPLTVAAVVVGVKLWARRSVAPAAPTVAAPVRVTSRVTVDAEHIAPERQNRCAICGWSSSRMSRVTRSDRDAVIRVCPDCAQKVQIANSEAAITAMQLLGERPLT